jgi:hypothetical protein
MLSKKQAVPYLKRARNNLTLLEAVRTMPTLLQKLFAGIRATTDRFAIHQEVSVDQSSLASLFGPRGFDITSRYFPLCSD